MPLSIGQVIHNNRYRVDALLGQGGMGAVYHAWDMSLNIPVAIKENLEATPGAQRQFGHEAHILACLSHPNLPRVTDYFFIPDQGQYLVMDFVEGEDLGAMVRRLGVLPEHLVSNWILQVCDALIYLHGQPSPIIHRDIKPANIKIRSDGRALLVDFGIAKIYDPHLSTTIGARAITPGYSPPEQYSGHTDTRSDVYALGATLYHLLTGHILPESTLRAAGNVPVLPPRQLNAHMSTQLEQVILSATEVVIDRRLQSVSEVSLALKSPATQLMSDKDVSHRKTPTPSISTGVLRFAPAAAAGGLMVVLIIIIAMSGMFQGWPAMLLPSPVATQAIPMVSLEPILASVTATSVLPSMLTPYPALALTPALAPLAFQTIPLDDIANASLAEDYVGSPTGKQTLGNVPFDLNGRAFKSQAQPAPNSTYPTDTALRVGASRVEQVYVLVTAGNAFTRWQGKTVGYITLVFDTAEQIEVELVLGTNLREWHVDENVVSSAPGVRPVWSGAIVGNPDLVGTLDMLTINVLSDRRDATLTQIEFHDSSASSTGSLDPALMISGVTIAHR